MCYYQHKYFCCNYLLPSSNMLMHFVNKTFLFCTIVLCIVHGNVLFPSLNHIKPSAPSAIQASAVQDLITRFIPSRTSRFRVDVRPDLMNDDLKDMFHIEKDPYGMVHITGTSGVAAAAGFNHYLKYFCNCQISWEAMQLNLPKILPDVNITVYFNDRFRYYQNVCTTSYSFVWWDWTQWEKHIDWMALNAFNLALAFNGQEAIWERVYHKFDLTDVDINEHFSGPAFLSWLRMGNIRSWAGPLSRAWHTRSLMLQKKILQRMRKLGIIPILPAFAGHLPRAFKRLYPNVTMIKLGSWCTFSDTYCCPYFLEPREKLFNAIGTAFIKEQIAEYGTDHLYSCDTFNELQPASDELTYLSNVGRSVYNAMSKADPGAIWVMQNWMFVNEEAFWSKERAKSFLTAVPIGKMIVLDLMSEQKPHYEQLEQYFGQPYIWCMLHNFGGTLGMFGSSSVVNTEPIRARNMDNSTMVGVGLTPEGINQNYVIYELMTETAWRNVSANLTEWIDNYTVRRYGHSDERVKNAWRILQNTIYDYNDPSNTLMGQYVIVNTPCFQLTTWKWYSYGDLLSAWSSFLEAADILRNSSTYQHDLVDITRQVLQMTGDMYYSDLSEMFKMNDTENFKKASEDFLEIFSDLEAILSTNKAFLLGPWLNSAKKAANDNREERQFEFNARNQVTLWGPRGEIMDYANKQWAGLMSNYYAPRWKMFLNYTLETMLKGQPLNQTHIDLQMFVRVEVPFTLDTTAFPAEPIGDTLETAQLIYKKWYPALNDLWSDEVILVN